jgi:hypothetical protein
VCLEQGTLSLVSTIEEFLPRESSDFGIENEEYGRRNTLRRLHGTPLSVDVGTNFSDKRRSLGHGV